MSTPWFTLTIANGLEATLLCLCVIGQEFIARRDRRGFAYWMAANVLAIILFVGLARWLMAFLYAYYLVKSVQGNLTWRRLEQEEIALAQRVQLQPATIPLGVVGGRSHVVDPVPGAARA